MIKKGLSKLFLTTPIFYVNSTPHIGHLYTMLFADAIKQVNQQCGISAFLTTGTDEHGMKLQIAAKTHGINEKEYCDKMSAQFQNLCKVALIGHNKFIRTTDGKQVIRVSRESSQAYVELH